MHRLDQGPARERAGVAAADEDPRGLGDGLDGVAAGHGQDDVLGKVLEVVDGLLDGVEPEAALLEVAVGGRGAVETVLEDDRRGLFLLRDEAVDGAVGEVAGVRCARRVSEVIACAGKPGCLRAALASPGVKRTTAPPANASTE